MDNKCILNPNYSFYIPNSSKYSGQTFCGASRVPLGGLREKFGRNLEKLRLKEQDIFVKRPVKAINAAGLLNSKVNFVSKVTNNAKQYLKCYVANIKHTYDHKIVYALIEKELFGKNSVNSITHDADKMILYLLGFPKSFVSSFHRKHSSHHPESGKNMNLRSMLCDNIASSPEFKPEKKRSLREHFNKSPELQNVQGLHEILEQYQYGESLNFSKIKKEKNKKYTGIVGFALGLSKLMLLNFF